jgi:hypothetical protein
MTSFFILCSGADAPLLKECSASERNKYAGIGATVFFTALMAFIASSYALYTVFDNHVAAITFGLVWGLLIFNLDRYIVSTLKKNERKWNEIVQAIPRLILAVIIAIVISKPLELKLFEKEINQVLLEEKNLMTLQNQDEIASLYSVDQSAFAKAIQLLKSEISGKEIEVNKLYTTYITEAEGTSGSNKLGKGPVYQEKRNKHDTALADLAALKFLNNTKIADLENQIAKSKTLQAEQVKASQPIIDNVDGLMARITALNKLPFITSFFIFLLFLAVETSPIIAKLLAPKGEYDVKLADRENRIKFKVTQLHDQQTLLSETDHQINQRVYTDLAEDDELYRYKTTTARQLMQEQTDLFYATHRNNG